MFANQDICSSQQEHRLVGIAIGKAAVASHSHTYISCWAQPVVLVCDIAGMPSMYDADVSKEQLCTIPCCRFPGHPESVDAIIAFDDDTIITGSSDGMLRVLNVLPNKLLGVIGSHDEFPVEAMALSSDR
jgi:WD40 repeat protein